MQHLSDSVRRCISLLVLAVPLAACGGGDRLGTPPRPDLDTLDPALREWVERGVEWVEAHPGDVDEWMRLCQTYHANELLGAAEECYARVAEAEPQNARAWYFLALVRRARGEQAGAFEAMARSQAAFSQYTPAHARQGAWLLEAGRTDEAAAAFARVIDVAPDDPAAAMGLALVRLDQGDAAAALAILEEARLANPGHAGVAMLADRVAADGLTVSPRNVDLGEGRVVGNDPWAAEIDAYLVGFAARFDVAGDMIDQKRSDSAVAILEELGRLYPEDVRVPLRLGQARLRAGDLAGARAAFADAVALDPADWRGHAEMATVLEMEGDSAGALDHLESATILAPEEVVPWVRKGAILRRQGNWAEAHVAFAEANRLGPGQAPIAIALGDCLARLGQWLEASAHYEEALRIDEGDATVHARVAAVYLKLGRLPDAQAALERALALDVPEADAVREMLEQVRQAQSDPHSE